MMLIMRYDVSPEVLGARDFDFTVDQQNQIRLAHQFGKNLRGYFINEDGRTKIADLNVLWGGE